MRDNAGDATLPSIEGAMESCSVTFNTCAAAALSAYSFLGKISKHEYNRINGHAASAKSGNYRKAGKLDRSVTINGFVAGSL